jgi:hypothetical protein
MKKSLVNSRITPKALKKFTRPDKPLSVALLESMIENLDTIIDTSDFSGGGSYPISGHELDYERWLRTYAIHAASAELGQHHKRAWNWAENIVADNPPPALIECWFRGGGKSTTVELIASRIAVKASRRFCLYVCATQDAADRHVNDIANTMEKCGIERAVNKYGYSKGWNAQKLRTANGFNVLAFGLDTGARGVKLDNLRPDMIILDDIDELDDSVNRVERKIRTITQTILPAKSVDCAIVFVQNRIHANAVMSQVISGELDMLQNRIKAEIVPAIYDMEYESYEREDGRIGYKITKGTAAWEHKNLEVCQREIDDFGIIAFLRECQHEVGVGGRFFPDFKEYSPTGEQWHVIDGIEIQPWWRVWASHDFGTGSPCAFYLYASDDKENIYVIDEIYIPGLVSSAQADNVLKMLESHKFASPAVKNQPDGKWNTRLEAIAFDWANTFPPAAVAQRIGEYPVEVWWRKGLPAVMAVKDRKAGWRRVKEWLVASRVTTVVDKTIIKPRIQIVRSKCPNLIRELNNTMADPRDPEDIDGGTKSDHAIDSFRYGLMYREYPVACPEVQSEREYKPSWLKNIKKDDYI